MKKLQLITAILNDTKAQDIVTIDVQQLTTITDYMLICTATSTRHAKAIADKTLKQLKTHGYKALHVVGLEDCHWVLLDCNDIILHIMLATTRDFYQLENLWQQETVRHVQSNS